MIINNGNNYSPYYNNRVKNTNNSNNNNNNVNFSGKGFDWFARQCEVKNNGSLTRLVFLVLGLVFMVGARFKDARGDDEKREVLTRDIPGVAIAAFGAPMFNNALAYATTKKTGIPIIQFSEKNPKSLKDAEFVSQKQIKDWYADFSGLKNPLITLSETVEKHGGSIKKVMAKLGLDKELQTISNSSSNKEILGALKKAQDTENFKTLEEKLKRIKDNKVFQTAKNAQATIKIGSIVLSAAILGFLIPRLNIVTTRKKHQQQNQNKTAQSTKSLTA